MSEAEDLKEVKGEEDNSSSWSDNADLNSVQQPSAAMYFFQPQFAFV